MPFSTAQRNAWLDTLSSVTVGLFQGDPLDGGPGVEVAGGTYARQSVTLAAAANGARAHSNTPVFDIPAGEQFDYVGYYVGGLCIGSDDIPAESYGSDGTYTLNSGSLTIT